MQSVMSDLATPVVAWAGMCLISPLRSPSEVKWLSLFHRFVIAFRSQGGVGETGLLVRLPEKNSTKAGESIPGETFSSPALERKSQNCGVFERFPRTRSRVSLKSRLC